MLVSISAFEAAFSVLQWIDGEDVFSACPSAYDIYASLGFESWESACHSPCMMFYPREYRHMCFIDPNNPV